MSTPKTPAPKLGYQEIAAELSQEHGLTVTKTMLQQFVKWFQHYRDRKAFKPDRWGQSATAPRHEFKRVTADAIKAAYVAQRIKPPKEAQ